jgi:hypothetical protein
MIAREPRVSAHAVGRVLQVRPNVRAGAAFKKATKVWFWEMVSGPGALISAEL